jgi:ribosome biogenesis GTPase A
MTNDINWYPGHMKKTKELIQENLKLVNVVVEVIDARIPISSRNPVLNEILKDKPRVTALNKSDLADPKDNEGWLIKLKREKKNAAAVALNCMSGKGIKELYDILNKMRSESKSKKPFRIMIAGVPNSGKSSLINRMTGRKSTRTGNRPGVTKGKQWLNLKQQKTGSGADMQVLDTPGILWPKFEDPNIGKNLAFCGSIKDEIMDPQELALELIAVLVIDHPDLLAGRYKLKENEIEESSPVSIMEAIASKRGFILPGQKIDYERTGRTVLDEFRSGKIGRITLEKPNEK